MAFGELLFYIVFSWYGFTRGDDGIQGLMPPFILKSGIAYYYFTLLIVAIASFLLWKITRSPFGYTLRMLRDNQNRAAFLGVDTREGYADELHYRRRICRISRSFVGAFSALSISGSAGLGSIGSSGVHVSNGWSRLFRGSPGGVHHLHESRCLCNQFTNYWPLTIGTIILCMVAFPSGRTPLHCGWVAGARRKAIHEPIDTGSKNVEKSFGGLMAAKQINFNLVRGAKEAIIGPNGAGKSTFFALVSGYHRPDRGSILFDGHDITGHRPHQVARMGISRAFQVSNIFSRLTVLENVRSAVQVSNGRGFNLFHTAERVGLERTEEILTLCNLNQKRNVPAGELSQGDKKKLELALALAGKPKLLLLDEPTAGMSLEESKETMDLVDRLNEDYGLTILFTEHDMAVVFNHAIRITLLHRGEVVI